MPHKGSLHVQYRYLQQLTENGTITWSTLYDRHIEEINANPIDILEQSLDKEADEVDNEEEDEPLEAIVLQKYF